MYEIAEKNIYMDFVSIFVKNFTDKQIHVSCAQQIINTYNQSHGFHAFSNSNAINKCY